MKRKLVSLLILVLLNLWIPYAAAEISQELDPMVSPDASAAMTSETPENGLTAAETSNVVSTADVAKKEKKVEATKKKSKKGSAKKSSSKKSSKSSSKKSKKSKKGSH